MGTHNTCHIGSGYASDLTSKINCCLGTIHTQGKIDQPVCVQYIHVCVCVFAIWATISIEILKFSTFCNS